MTLPLIYVKRNKNKPLHAGHPWVFAESIGKQRGPEPQAGDEVRVLDTAGQFLGRGLFSPHSAIAVRLFSYQDKPIDEPFLKARIERAIRFRFDGIKLGTASEAETESTTTAFRLINSEGDGLPGLIVDVYGDYLCVQFGTAGIDRRSEFILDTLEELLRPTAIFDKGDRKIRKLEKLAPPSRKILRGVDPEAPIEVFENDLSYGVNLSKGESQKTGLYLDQRENRQRFGFYTSQLKQQFKGKTGKQKFTVLDAFSYNAGFALNAFNAVSGKSAEFTLIDSSAIALEQAQMNLENNGVEDASLINCDYHEAFNVLEKEKQTFDLIAMDPPKFASSKKSVDTALEAYQKLNEAAGKLLKPNSILFTSSCSGSISPQAFERAVATGLKQAGKRATVLERRGPGADHTSPPAFDPGQYLKCLVLRVYE